MHSIPEEVVAGQGQLINGMSLYHPNSLRNNAMWQCCFYIAPRDDPKQRWTVHDAQGVYCVKCEKNVTHDPIKNNHGVSRHMEKHHQDLLDDYSKTHPGSTDSVNKWPKRRTMKNYYSSQLVSTKKASASDKKN